MDWEHADSDLRKFVRALSNLHRVHPVFRRRRFFWGQPSCGDDLDDVSMARPCGPLYMTDEHWDAECKAIAVF